MTEADLTRRFTEYCNGIGAVIAYPRAVAAAERNTKEILGTMKLDLLGYSLPINLDYIFAKAVFLGGLPVLDAWQEVELYRKFNGGHLPNIAGPCPTHVPYVNKYVKDRKWNSLYR